MLSSQSPARWALLLALVLLLPATAVRSQDLVYEARISFPEDTKRLEFSDLVKLRLLPEYVSLRERYVGPRLRSVEASLSKLGIREADMDQVILGWHPIPEEMRRVAETNAEHVDPSLDTKATSSPRDFSTLLCGLAAGRFDRGTIAQHAATLGLSETEVGAGLNGYCFQEGASGTCVVVLSESLGAFGTRASLAKLLDARNGRGSNISSDPLWLKLLHEVRKEALVWGVATGATVADWFQGWVPGPSEFQMDWQQQVKSVEVLSYSLELDERFRLETKLDCKTPGAASTLKQLFEGLKLLQELLWRSQNAGRQNPLSGFEVEASDRRVSLKVSGAHSDLTGYSSFPLRHEVKP